MRPHDFRLIEPQLRARGIFSFFAQENVRFCDTDMMGHVNNTSYGAYCETGRIGFNRWLMPGYKGGGGMVARVAINYLAETKFPARVEIGTGVVHVGTSSYVLGQGLFVDDLCVATAEGVLVRINRETRRPEPIPDDMRAGLMGGMLKF